MGLQDTPNANRLCITLFGRRNSGKSSLLNAIVGQTAAVVSDVAGTTTDTVNKAIELNPIGACLIVDTPGFDDVGELGELRVERTLKALERADIALMLCESDDCTLELEWLEQLRRRGVPVILLLNKVDERSDVEHTLDAIERQCGQRPLCVSALHCEGIDELRSAILRCIPSDYATPSITGSLVAEGDSVVLVMPQDVQAPRGRLILPQVQTIRELLDKKCVVTSCTVDKFTTTLALLNRAPRLIITDSQAFATVYASKPKESALTSFSVLMAAYKGDINAFVEGASAIERLTSTSRVLIAEACTHAPMSEDIGRVKIPRMLRARAGQGITIDVVAGEDFPRDLSSYDLIIHCGGCMFNRKYLLNRIAAAQSVNIPITNYGVTIAYLTGILDKIVW